MNTLFIAFLTRHPAPPVRPVRLLRSVALVLMLLTHLSAPRPNGDGRRAGTPRSRLRFAALFALRALLAVVAACRADPGYRGRTSEDWIAELSAPDADGRADAAFALGRILELQPKAPDVVAALIRALGDTSDAVRLAAGTALSTEGVRSPAAVPGLVAVLGDSAHPNVRRAAATTLGYFGAAARAAVPALVRALDDRDGAVRAEAARALGLVGHSAAAAVPDLRHLVDDPDPSARLTAVEAVMNIGPPPSVSVPVFERALADSSAAVRSSAAYALGSLKQAAAPALGALLAVLPDSEPSVRAAAAFAIGEIGPPARRALAPLRALAARDPSEAVRLAASDAIAGVEGRPVPRRPIPEPTARERCASNPSAPGC